MADDIRSRIHGFIASEILLDEDVSTLADDTPLLGSVLDSLGLVQLVAYLEEEFDVTIDDGEVTMDNFKTIFDIERLVSQKVQTG